ncbi:MAG: hypothetical protein Q8916_09455 [Bacteroidota bacterium]|nr:hypothetical protein [Bacteroidota bacterium]MDP4230614.1 hypothetical protein [Bacteroidota bacterium]MDP4235486.1 hypothetical protein [Bacteroidota bacterium]
MNTKIHIPLAGSNRTMRLAALVCIGLFTILSFGRSFGQQTGSGQSDVPRIMSYQGVISDHNGVRLPDGNYPITASLYEDASGTSKIWQGRYTVAVTGGVFTAMLGSGDSPLPELKAMNKPIWIGIQVGASPEMRPLTQLASAPYTLNIPDNSVTKAKMGTDYIGSISINGEKVQGKGAELNITTGDGIKMDFNPADNSILLHSASSDGGMHTAQALSPLGLPPCSADNAVPNTNTIGWGASNTVGTVGTLIGYASLLGGWNNTASGDFSSIVGGASNTANACGAFVGGGGVDVGQCQPTNCGAPAVFFGNTASAVSTVVVGGVKNSAVSDLAFVGGGRNNTAGGGGGITQTVGGGEHNQALGDGAVIAGGEQNTATDIHSSICGGLQNLTLGTTGHQHIGGGQFNTANAGFTTISGGQQNTTNNDYATVGGGWNNVAGGGMGFITSQTVGGGDHNTAVGDGATIAGGEDNTAGAMHDAIGGGRDNATIAAAGACLATHNVISGGLMNRANGQFSMIPGGWQGQTRDFGQMAHASGSFGGGPGAGDAQTSVFVLRNQTAPGGGAQSLFLDGVGGSNRITIPANGAMALHIMIIGKAQGCGAGMPVGGWDITLYAYDGCGAVLLGAPTIRIIGPLPPVVPAWTVAIAAGPANACSAQGTVDIKVNQGGTATPVDWVASVQTSEVVF